MSRRLLIAAVALATLCVGMMTGNSLRDKYERGIAGPSSDLYASAEASADTAVMGGGVSASSYFDQIRQVLLSDFVDPVSNETEMGRGAVREMLRELRDPASRFYEPDDWAALQAKTQGKYSGIGADVAFRPEITNGALRIPLRIVSVAEGGPADKAGLEAGDWVDEIDGKWVVSRSLFEDLAAANLEREKKKITQEEFSKIFESLRAMSLNMMAQDEALHQLLSVPGTVTLKVLRNGKPISVKLVRGEHSIEPIEKTGETIRIRCFTKGVSGKLAGYVGDASDITLDIRDNPGGDYASMAECLEALLPPGPFAKYRREPSEPLKELALRSGTNASRTVTVIVNRGTSREAELFVVALRDKMRAKIEGGATAGLGLRTEAITLSDGSGYTLTSARFYDLQGQPLMKDDMPEAKK